MPVSIGVTTQVIAHAKWYKHLGEFGLRTIEINRQNSKLHFNHYFLEKVKGYVRGFDLSIHSGTAGVFQPHESFTEANLAILAAELDICRFLDARQFVFHLGEGYLSPSEKGRLREIASRARDLGIEMLYESNSVLVAGYVYDVLESFPTLDYVLDLGHLNNGLGTGRLGADIDEFMALIRPRVTYLHASNNTGRRDEHNGVDSGSLDWRGVLGKLDLARVNKIIVEVRKAGMVAASVEALRQYLADSPAAAPAQDLRACPTSHPLPSACIGRLEEQVPAPMASLLQ